MTSYHHGNGFNQIDNETNTYDPTFMVNPSYNASQLQGQHLHNQMQNGLRNGSPAFNHPIYQTNQVIPSKRAREEGYSNTSPPPATAMLPMSRSQTPQGTYRFSNHAPPHPAQQPHYAHLQNGSTHTSPSPVMSHPMRSGIPQRISTNSPHPFSPTPPQFSAQASPSHSDHDFNPPLNPMSSTNMHMFAPPNQQRPQVQQQHDQQLEQQRALYAMRLRQHAAQAQQGRPNMNHSTSPLQVPSGQFTNLRQAPPTMARPNNPDTFLKNLSAFMQSQGKRLDVTPVIGGRKYNIVMLYMAVNRLGGYGKVSQSNAWSQICQAMHLPLDNPSTAHFLRAHYEQYLLPFDEALQSNMQRQRATSLGGLPPAKQMPSASTRAQPQYVLPQGQQHEVQINSKQLAPASQLHRHVPSINGLSTPQTPKPMGQNHARNSVTGSIEATPPQAGASFPIRSPASTKHGRIAAPSPDIPSTSQVPSQPEVEPQIDLADVYDPRIKRQHKPHPVGNDNIPIAAETFGGIDVALFTHGGQELSRWKPNVPSVIEMGTIDIQSLILSLQSGLHAEVRLALDSLASLSIDPRVQLELKHCEDLVESLIDCAEDQVELLAENTTEVSDDMLVTSYEDVVRGCHIESEILHNVPEYGSPDYDLDRAVDKLICVTTILRNLSFMEPNRSRLAHGAVIKFLSTVIRYLGTRNMLLRTNRNTLDFMKDLVIILSNISHAIEIASREQALCLLQFLLAFAPSPPPNHVGETISFSHLEPSIHKYLPPAIDSLAKLLARDEPNRTHYRTIFVSDIISNPPFDLLTRAFALAISPVPDQSLDVKRGNVTPVVEARKPYLMQGMLAAEILSNLAPGYETGLTKSWLYSEDGFSQNLAHLIISICVDASGQMPQLSGHAPPKTIEDDSLLRIASGGIAVLRSLAEKSRDPETLSFEVPNYALPAKESLLGALKIGHPKLQGVLRQLCVYAGLNA